MLRLTDAAGIADAVQRGLGMLPQQKIAKWYHFALLAK